MFEFNDGKKDFLQVWQVLGDSATKATDEEDDEVEVELIPCVIILIASNLL